MALPTMAYQQDAREAVTHFKALAQAVDLPMMIYNNYVAYKVGLLPEDFVAINDQKNIVAVNESSHDSRRITDMINVLGDRSAPSIATQIELMDLARSEMAALTQAARTDHMVRSDDSFELYESEVEFKGSLPS